MLALEQVQNAFEGETERLDLKSEEDVVNLVKEVRKERLRKKRRKRSDENHAGYQCFDRSRHF